MHVVLARHDHLQYAMLRRISGVDQFPASLRSIRIEQVRNRFRSAIGVLDSLGTVLLLCCSLSKTTALHSRAALRCHLHQPCSRLATVLPI